MAEEDVDKTLDDKLASWEKRMELLKEKERISEEEKAARLGQSYLDRRALAEREKRWKPKR